MKFAVVIALLSLQFNNSKGIRKKCLKGILEDNLRCSNIFIWNNQENDFIALLNITSEKFVPNNTDIKEITIRVVADNMLPYITSSNDSSLLSGYLGEIWTIIQTTLQFRSHIISVGYDAGLQIISNKGADIMLAAAVEKKGLLNVEFSQPYFYNWYYLFIKKPKATASSTSYFRTLNDELWFASISLFVGLTCLFWVTVRIIHKYSHTDRNISITSCFLTVSGGFLNQGHDIHINCYSGRMQQIIALLFGYLLYSAMNAVLVAQLAIFDLKLPFNSLEEIAVKGTHSLCVRTNSFVYNNFTDSNRTLLPKWKGIVNSPRCPDINHQENVAKIICNEGIIVLESRVVISAVRKKFKLPCDLAYLNKKLFRKSNHFIFLKSFKYKKLINTYVKKLNTAGIMKRLENKWISDAKSSDNDLVESPQVTIHHVSSILNILASMTVVSTIVMVVEIAFKKYMTNVQVAYSN